MTIAELKEALDKATDTDREIFIYINGAISGYLSIKKYDDDGAGDAFPSVTSVAIKEDSNA